MNPDVADAIPRLAESGVLPPDAAPRLLRVARGELLSVHWELRALLYVGVLLVTGGVGLLVKENLDRIGPVAIAAGIGLAAAAAGRIANFDAAPRPGINARATSERKAG
jgi:hypothetical protein